MEHVDSGHGRLTHVAQTAFPVELTADVIEAVTVLKAAPYPPSGSFSVTLAGAPLAIPYRLYEAPPRPQVVAPLPATARSILHCLLTRHHDGRVRQEHVQALLDVREA